MLDSLLDTKEMLHRLFKAESLERSSTSKIGMDESSARQLNQCAMLPIWNRVVSVSRSKYLPLKSRGIAVSREPQTIGARLRERRLGLGIFQAEAAHKMGISTVTLSRWECDKVYPAWAQQPAVIRYLQFDPFTDPRLGSPKGNKAPGVAILSAESVENLGQAIILHCIQKRKTRQQFARELGMNPKTVRNWETGRRQPSALLRKRIATTVKLDAITDPNPASNNIHIGS